MTSKAENTFIAGVHKHLPREVYREKTNNPYRGGTPDVYYEATRAMWAEYKFIEVPKRDATVIVPALSSLQADWLKRNYDNGHQPWVIVGHEGGGVIFYRPAQWLDGFTRAEFMVRSVSKADLAAAIRRQLL